MSHSRSQLAGLAGAGLALLAAGPAHADITVIGRYTFVNGDTATRASYFTSNRVRVSTPDGREVIFDAKAGRVTLIDHQRRVFWDGPVARADSIIDVTDGSRWDDMVHGASARLKTEWDQAMEFPPDSILVSDSFKTRMIAGYPCNLWTEHAGSYVSFECWMAAALAPVDSYSEPTEDVVLAALLDPIARAVMGMFWSSLDSPELCLAARMTFDSPTQHGTFHWEAVKVVDARVPASAWSVPDGYRPALLVSEIPADVSQFTGRSPAQP